MNDLTAAGIYATILYEEAGETAQKDHFRRITRCRAAGRLKETDHMETKVTQVDKLLEEYEAQAGEKPVHEKVYVAYDTKSDDCAACCAEECCECCGECICESFCEDCCS